MSCKIFWFFTKFLIEMFITTMSFKSFRKYKLMELLKFYFV